MWTCLTVQVSNFTSYLAKMQISFITYHITTVQKKFFAGVAIAIYSFLSAYLHTLYF